MPQTIERARQADERLNNPKLAPPGEMLRQLQENRSLTQVGDAVSIGTIDRSNSAVGRRIMEGLRDCMMLSKKLYGKVGSFSMVFGGLKRILGGI